MDEVENDIINYQCRGLSYLSKPDMKFDNSFYDAKTKFSICFITIFLKQTLKKDTTLSLQKFENTTWTRAKKLGRLWTWNENPICAADIWLSWELIMLCSVQQWHCKGKLIVSQSKTEVKGLTLHSVIHWSTELKLIIQPPPCCLEFQKVTFSRLKIF